MEGLHTAVVKKLDGDPAEECRIQVELPWLESDSKLLWARLSTLYATGGSGAFWLPEPGDEVLVDGSKHKPPYEYTAENHTKAFVTREKLRIEFDEEKKIITVSTPGNNKVELSDDGKSITLSDANGNEVKMDKERRQAGCRARRNECHGAGQGGCDRQGQRHRRTLGIRTDHRQRGDGHDKLTTNRTKYQTRLNISEVRRKKTRRVN